MWQFFLEIFKIALEVSIQVNIRLTGVRELSLTLSHSLAACLSLPCRHLTVQLLLELSPIVNPGGRIEGRFKIYQKFIHFWKDSLPLHTLILWLSRYLPSRRDPPPLNCSVTARLSIVLLECTFAQRRLYIFCHEIPWIAKLPSMFCGHGIKTF